MMSPSQSGRVIALRRRLRQGREKESATTLGQHRGNFGDREHEIRGARLDHTARHSRRTRLRAGLCDDEGRPFL